MRAWLLRTASLAALALLSLQARAGAELFSFGVISPAMQQQAFASALADTIATADAANLAFVVVNGIKTSEEPCTDDIYEQRKAMLDVAQHGLIVSLTASDWAMCKNKNEKSSATGRLQRLRELLFGGDFSIGASKLPLVRQSTSAPFRDFVENARWEFGNIMFATINLPRNNNHYVTDAGRNSEFEDRLVANRAWLRRVFTHAEQKKLDGIVLFSDGNPLAGPARPAGKRDGYREIRSQILSSALEFDGKVLVIHNDASRSTEAGIRWRKNVGELYAGRGWRKLTVVSSSRLFQVQPGVGGSSAHKP